MRYPGLIRLVPIVVMAGLLLWLTMVVTAAGVFRSAKPDYALRLADLDAGAKAASAQRLLAANQRPPTRAAARRLAIDALRRDPTAVTAVTALGLLAALDGDLGRAERAFRYAERLTRRDPISQLWLIERRVGRNDIPGALAQYDTALRGSASLRAQLYPILLSASADPAIARPLNRLLRDRPNWWSEFLFRLIWEGRDAEAITTVSRGLLDPRIEDQRTLLSVKFARVAAMGRPDLAWSAYREVAGASGDVGAALRDGDFARDGGLPPFDWAYAEESEFAPDRRPRERPGGSFALHLPDASRDGEVARQLLRLPAGRHQVTAMVGDVAPGPERPYIKLTCAVGNAEILKRPFPDAGPEGGRMSAPFTVSANCPYQWLSIGVRGSIDVRAETSPWIAELRIR